MGSRFNIQSIHIVLTARCNLSCSYCFENKKSSKRMNWRVLRTSLDFALGASDSEMEFIFSGGEPLLEMPLIRRAVAHVERNRSPSLEVRYSILTNGTLLNEKSLAFLDRFGVETQISIDGVPEVQNRRSPGSFVLLDRLLDNIHAAYPRFYRRLLNVAAVVTPDSVTNLPRSIAYFLEKRVPTILLAPEFTGAGNWGKTDIDRLDAVFGEIFEISRRRYEETGEIPIRLFRSLPRDPPAGTRGRSLCGIMRGETPAVDPDGQVFGCGAVVNSYQEIPSERVGACLQKIRLGHVEQPGLRERLADFRRLTRPVDLFDNKQHNWSSYGRCADCRYLFYCSVCPVSIGYVPDNTDLRRVPDFICAYNRVSLKYRERFWKRRLGVGDGCSRAKEV